MATRYRRLKPDELKEMEKEFIDFLVVNGVIASDWEAMKLDAPERSDRLIDLFSDAVMETTLQRIQFLDFKDSERILCFHCLTEKMVLVGLENAVPGYLNLADPQLNPKDFLSHTDDFRVFTKDKRYDSNRELEIFEMLDRGASISDGTLFKQFCLLL